jgi:hypothetical protein
MQEVSAQDIYILAPSVVMVFTANTVNNIVCIRKAIAYIKHLTPEVGGANHTKEAESRLLITKLSCILNSKLKR